MKYVLIGAAVMLSASPAWAITPVSVPEMDGGFGLTAAAAGAERKARENNNGET